MKLSKIHKSKNEEEFIKNAEDYAKKIGVMINPDKEAITKLLTGFFKNKREKGEFYCPCRIVRGDKKKDKEIICPCVFHRGEIELQGHCKCLLFVNNQKTY